MSLSLASEIHVFPCPYCNETINTSMQLCQFCKEPVNHAYAERAAERTAQINSACSDGSFIRTMAWALIPFFFLSFLPVLPGVGGFGFLFLLIAIPVMCLRWWRKYAAIPSTDPTFLRARKTTSIIGMSVAFLLFIRLVLFALVVFAVATRQIPS